MKLKVKKPNKEKVGAAARRAGWIFLAVLFTVTALGVGVVGFWQATHQPKDNSTSAAKAAKISPMPPSNEPKLAGTKLADFTPVLSVDKLDIIDLQVGTGKEAAASSTVTAHYTGALAKDGTIFESSKDSGQPATFPLGQVIKGWQQGVPGMKEGGKRRLIIPASLAYGATGSPPKIGPNEPLVFDIELISVK